MLYGLGTCPWNVLFGRFASGRYLFMMFSAVGSIRSAGIVLLGNGRPLTGSTITLLSVEKSPVRCAAVGTTAELRNVVVSCRSPEYVPKTNVLLWMIGPPNDPPN